LLVPDPLAAVAARGWNPYWKISMLEDCLDLIGTEDVQAILRRLEATGVESLAGQVFLGGEHRGAPPEEALVPRVVMRPDAKPLSTAEKAAAVRAIREQVLDFVTKAVADQPMAVELVHARYCVDPVVGIDLAVEFLGLDRRVVRATLS